MTRTDNLDTIASVPGEPDSSSRPVHDAGSEAERWRRGQGRWELGLEDSDVEADLF